MRMEPESAGIRVERMRTIVVLPARSGEKRKDRALLRCQVDLVEHQMAAERLAHVPGHDPRRAGPACHSALPPRWDPGPQELAGGLERLSPFLPLLLQHGKPLHQEIGERGPLQ